MKFLQHNLFLPGVALALAISSLTPNAQANVYATNLRLNGTTNSPTIVTGQEVSIGYLLNEPASAGVRVQILRGTNLVRTMALAPGTPGTSRGTNTVTWNGTDDTGAAVAGGDYAFSITAAAAGYTNWTQTSSDTNAGNQLTRGWGIAVNQNTNSAYYGRVFVANAYAEAGDPLGFHKLNADGSPAEEGMLSTGGYRWVDYPYYQSPFRVKVGADDRFYALDLSGNGVVLSWDQQITTNSMLRVLRDDPGDNNNPAGNLLSGFCITGTGTNQQLWMANDYGGAHGIYRWNVQPNGTLATNDPGTNVVDVGGSMTESCFDVDVDKNARIYALCQPLAALQYKIMRFPPYTNTPLLTADWKVDNTSPSGDPYAIAVNPAATYVAVARAQSKSVFILNANTGATVATIGSNGYPHAVAWDNVGNVYPCFDASLNNSTNSVWQSWSPPGANQATTYGLQTIQLLQAPQITSLVPSGPNLILHFTGPANYPPWAFTVLSGSVPMGITNVVANAIITGGGGVFQAIVPINGSQQYYFITMPTTTSWIYITRIQASGGTATLNFTGSISDQPSAFTVLNGFVPTGITNVVASPVITGGSGMFQAIVPASDPQQFYRIQK